MTATQMLLQVAILPVLVLLGCGEAPSVSAVPPNAVSTLPGPDAADLRILNFIPEVGVHEATDQPTHRIIHLLNWHFVEKEDFTADLRDANLDLTDEEINDRHHELVATVEAVQAEQRQVLRYLIDKYGQRGVYLEGLSDELLPDLQRHVKTLREFEANKPKGDAIMRHLLEGGPVSVVVLGGGHDLSDNAERLSGGTCEVLRVTVKAYHEAAE